MPPTKEAVTLVALNYDELSAVDAALGHAADERDDERAREKAERLQRKLLKMDEEVRERSPERTRVELGPSEYGTLMEALEFFVATGQELPQIREDVFDLWERLLVEGGHVTPGQLRGLRRRYGR